MEKTIKKRVLNFLLLAAIFALTVWSVFHGENLPQVFQSLKMADIRYVLLAVACVVLFILGEAVVICYLLRTLGQRVRMRHCCLFSFVGFFYSCITPSASGGQPMQAYYMRKAGIPVAVSTVILAIVTIIYKLVLVFMGLAVVILRPPQLMAHLDGSLTLVYIGLGLNVVFVAALLLLVFYPGIVRNLAKWAFRVADRIRPFRDRSKQNERLERIIGQYQGAAEYYRGHMRVIVHVFLITLLQRIVLFAVTWFAYRAFSLEGHSLPLIVSLQAMIAVAVDMLPLPGGMGISENLFLSVFEGVFGEDLVLPGMVISRGVSYYTQLLISAIMTVVAMVIFREKKERKGKNQ